MGTPREFYMKSLFVLFFCGLLIFVTSLSAVAEKGGVPTGPYESSCTKIRLVHYTGVWDFYATCSSKEGTWETHYMKASQSSPVDNSWENINGNLFRERTVPSGPWRESCSGSTYVAYDSGLWTLEASCKKRDGTYVKSELFISPKYQAKNVDGVLRCVSGNEMCMD